MRYLLIPAVLIAALAWAGATSVARAQEKTAAPMPADAGAPPAAAKELPPPAAPACTHCDSCHGEVRAVVVPEKHVRYCYDVKEEEYVDTRCAHTPILGTLCHS